YCFLCDCLPRPRVLLSFPTRRSSDLLAVAWSMKPPHFLASVLIPLNSHDPQLLADKLRGVEGVAEVVIVASENTIYLKVDQRQVDRKMLAALVDKQSLVS